MSYQFSIRTHNKLLSAVVQNPGEVYKVILSEKKN